MIFRGGRQRFLDRFEPRGDAYAYRSTISSPGVLVSAEERTALLEQYENRRSLFVVYLFADLPVTVGVTVLAYAIDPSHKAYPIVAWLTLLFSPAIVGVWSESGPNKLIKDRPAIDKGPPNQVIEMRKIERSSWGSLVWNIVFAALCGCLMAADHTIPILYRIVFVIIALVALAVAIKEIVLKVQFSARSKSIRQ